MSSPHKLLVVSHVVHYQHGGCLYAYGPYVREIDVWAGIFPQILVAAPCRTETPPGDSLPFSKSNIRIVPQLETGGDTKIEKIKQFLLLPIHLMKLGRAMGQADAIHVRCPGNLGLLGCALAPLFSRCRVAKYAGQWNGYTGESRAGRWQRKLLASKWWGQPVLVYGDWADQPKHIVPFFTSMMTREMVNSAVESAVDKTLTSPLRVLFSGRLEAVKRIDALIDALHILADKRIPFEAVFVGGGTLETQLKAKVNGLGLAAHVRFTGALPYQQGVEYCKWAHCLVLPSQHSEGWSKAIAEAMCYGVVCVGVAHGHLPAMMEGRGILTANGTPEEIANALETLASDAQRFRLLSANAVEWARHYSIDDFRTELVRTLETHWQVSLAANLSDTPRSEHD